MRAFGADGTLRYALEAIARHSERLCVTFSELMMLAFNFRIAPQALGSRSVRSPGVAIAELCAQPRSHLNAPRPGGGTRRGRAGTQGRRRPHGRTVHRHGRHRDSSRQLRRPPRRGVTPPLPPPHTTPPPTPPSPIGPFPVRSNLASREPGRLPVRSPAPRPDIQPLFDQWSHSRADRNPSLCRPHTLQHQRTRAARRRPRARSRCARARSTRRLRRRATTTCTPPTSSRPSASTRIPRRRELVPESAGRAGGRGRP
jgi:hypothetical protein